MPFGKEFPWKMFWTKYPGKISTRKMPQGNKISKKYSFYGKMPLGKMPNRKKGFLKMPLQNILSTHGKKPRRKLSPRKSALKNALLKE